MKAAESGHEKAYRNPALAADAVIPDGNGIVFVRRATEPFKGRWAPPGGFVEYGERVEDAAKREVREETGLEIGIVRLIGVYSDPKRDPRKHVVTVSFLAKKVGGSMRPSGETSEVRVLSSVRESELAFDHAQILRDAGYGRIIK